MNCQRLSLVLLILAVGCAPDFHPIPSTADPSETDTVALLKPVASEISWHENGRVRGISLVGDNISEAHLTALHKLAQLEELQLMCPITNDTLKEVASFQNLRALDVQHTAITDDGLRYLAAAPALRLVVLDGTSISDRGLSHLADIRTLANVFAEKTSISEDGAMEFHGRRPDCRIQYDDGVIAPEPTDEREPE